MKSLYFKAVLLMLVLAFISLCSDFNTNQEIYAEQTSNKNKESIEHLHIDLDDIPDWVMNPPHKEGKSYYGSGIGVADDIRELGLAKKTADADALEELAKIVMARFSKKVTKRSIYTITPEDKKIPGAKKVEESTQEIMEVTL